MNIDRVSPKEFLRARRPEKFSDSVVEEQAALDRSMLEYHLDTLTSRSQEVKFAIFARHLAEREICPNLMPQTGPTGGGDSKVDSETYPVADDLSLGWWVGIGREAASERWAFAFSAKRKWADKVRSDVASAVETGRDYRKIFFVSNQFIRDKARAQMEDELRAKYGIDVRILDRTWILDKVFGGKHEALAIEDLELATSKRTAIRKGPRDTQRETDLKKLEDRIQEALQQQRFGFQLAEDCIDAADLATQLERPRTETDGLFERAEQMISKCGTDHQRLKCAYQKALTAFWWYEDYEEFAKLYIKVEDCTKGSQNAYDLELLTNLWFLLQSTVIRGRLDATRVALHERSETLAKELERLSQDDNRPGAALQAQTLLLLMQFQLKLGSKESIDSVLRDLQEVVHKCEGLVGYPLDPLVKFVTQMGENFHGISAYDGLFETVVKLSSTRKGEVSAARMLLERGTQQFRADRPYDAIRTLGRVLRKLCKHESRHDLVRALYVCGCAYERVGLLWAARGAVLGAASLATAELSAYGEVTRAQAACCSRLKWLELQLGRLPQILAWHEADIALRVALVAKGHDESEFGEGEREFDLGLGILLLKTDFWELKWLSRLPDVLERMGLFGSCVALIYALGHEEELRGEGSHDVWGDDDPHAVALKWRDLPASEELPAKPALYEERKVTLKSNLLGCKITVESENASPCIELSESILAALESLLSTGTVDRMICHEPTLTIAVRKSDFASDPFEFELQEHTGRPHLSITCAPFSPHILTIEAQEAIKERIIKLLTTAFARIVMTRDFQKTFEELVRDELALERSLNFTGSFVTVANVLGSSPRNRISSWSDPSGREYPPKRAEAWDADAPPAEEPTHPGAERWGQGEPPQELLDHSGTKHTQIQNVSLIRMSLWDKAGWMATVFGTSHAGSGPPVLAPVFTDSQAARQIFLDWRNELGIRDTQERLRLTIVRHVDKMKPFSYRVVFGSNPKTGLSSGDVRYVLLVNRSNTMDAESYENLERFLRSYEKFGEYFLAAAFTSAGTSEPKIIWDHQLLKRELHVREAWQIGRNDPDSMAIQEDDEPFIPDGVKNPPVVDLLRWIRERSPNPAPIVGGPKQELERNDPCPCGSGKKYKKCHGA